MGLELLSLLGGGIAGFIFRLIGTITQRQADLTEMAIKTRLSLDQSHDKASKRDPGSWVRRLIVASVLFAIVGAPFVLAILGIPTTVETSGPDWWNPFSWFASNWEEIHGFLILQEVRTTLLALVGFYFGGSAARGA